MKENWTDLHIEFAETFFPDSDKTIQKKWEEKGFDFREAKKWVEIGFKPKETLNGVCYFCLPDYWRKNGFIFHQQVHEWIKAGLKKNEFDFACYLKNKGFAPKNINLLEEKNKKIEAQDWLETIYPSEKRKNTKFVMITNERKFDGNLLINNWENLESFYCDKNDFSRLEITNCPNLKKIFAKDNKLVNFWIDKCPQIEELHLDNNELKDLSIFSNLNSLKVLSVRSNHFDSGLEYLPASVEKIYCTGNLFDQLKDSENNYQPWRKGHPELIARAQEITELKNILFNLSLSLINHHASDEIVGKGLLIFIFETEERIKELKEINKGKFRANQEIPPKSN